MRRLHRLLLAGLSLLLAASCSRSAPQPESPLRPVATVKDIMDSLIDPSADVLWDAVSSNISLLKGTVERAPATEEEWATVRRSAIALIEATNLLLMDGRRVAQPGQRADKSEVELPPEQIEAMINQDRQAWNNLAHALADAGTMALKAIDAKSPEGVFEAGEPIDAACENCHLKYWYPPDKSPGR